MELKTTRLFLRPCGGGDFPHIFRLQSDPETMRFIRQAETEEAPVRKRMAMWAKYAAENPGYGVWVVESLEQQHFAGYAVLRHKDWKPGSEIEAGYAISKEHWGKGYATEVTLRLLAHARQTMNLSKVVAFTDPENHSSNRVLEKCGFTCTGTEHIYDGESKRWEIHFSRPPII